VATGLTPAEGQRAALARYLAADYDELVDCPVEMGDFWSGSFKAQAACRTALWWPAPAGLRRRPAAGRHPPHLRGRHPLLAWQKKAAAQELPVHAQRRRRRLRRAGAPQLHRTDLRPRDLPRLGGRAAATRTSEGYTTLLGLISHEYFHTWNVKRLRPAEFARYDYARRTTPQLLWFFEGFTSYYDDLLLRRAGLLDDAAYLKLLNKTSTR
jgi:predicted metalloprotease with PDZ domain